MSILIDKNKCVGCKQCFVVCPGNLIKSDDDGKAFMKYPRDCWGCSSCVKECKAGAIAFYLGADIGGRGSKLTVREEGDIIHWYVEKADGEVAVIAVNRKDSNKY
jgi:Ferredoxin